MKMKLLTAVAALLACSGALAKDAPPPPWEKLKFHCTRYENSYISETMTFYRHPEKGEQVWSGFTESLTHKVHYVARDDYLYYGLMNYGENEFDRWVFINRATGEAIETEGAPGMWDCELTANKF